GASGRRTSSVARASRSEGLCMTLEEGPFVDAPRHAVALLSDLPSPGPGGDPTRWATIVPLIAQLREQVSAQDLECHEVIALHLPPPVAKPFRGGQEE